VSAATTRIVSQLDAYQHRGAEFLAARGFAMLWDEPGCGKTASTIAGADLAGARKVLVLCPAVVREHWASEIVRWSRYARQVDVVAGRANKAPGPDVTIVSHATLAHKGAIAAVRAGAPYDLVIVDEAAEFRDFSAARTRALFAPAPDGLWSWTNRLWLLTGTPLVNSAADLYPVFHGPLRSNGTWFEFCLKFTEVRQGFDGPHPTGVKDARSLAELLRPHTLRRTLDSVGIHLPPLATVGRMLQLPPAALQEAMAGLEGWSPERVRAALQEKDELQDAAISRVRRALGIAKVQGLIDLVGSNHMVGLGPQVVFFQHTDTRRMMEEVLGQCLRIGRIDGQVTRKALREAEQGLQAGNIDVLFVQTQAGGMGLTLTRANHAVVAELPWTSMALEQAVKRVHRRTQTRPCTAEIVRAQDCWLDDVLASVVGRKRQASNELLSLMTTGS
jgi:SWI/SNF-related matrix-associated actin-dependent regulator of chromatin subfamily A-like protein 1